jgi:hypothetical protein
MKIMLVLFPEAHHRSANVIFKPLLLDRLKFYSVFGMVFGMVFLKILYFYLKLFFFYVFLLFFDVMMLKIFF